MYNVKIVVNPLTEYEIHDIITTVRWKQYKMNGKAHTANV